MATKQIKKLSDLQKITTATGDQMIPVVDASGNVNPIKLTDLAQVVAELIGIASNSKDGLLSRYFSVVKLPNFNSLGQTDIYLKIRKISNTAGFLTLGCGNSPVTLLYLTFAEIKRSTTLKVIFKYAILEIYAKEDNEYLYLSKNYGGGLSKYFPLDYGNIESLFEYTTINSSGIPSDATDVEIQ